MGGALEGAEVAPLSIAPPDLSARVVYLPVRHHSPACAWHVDRVIRRVRPARVLVEGPRDATPLVPFLVDPALRPPVAIFTSFVDRRAEGEPVRHGAYYPLCDYSPELAAIRAAQAIGAEARFVDLSFPEMVVAEAAAAARGRTLQDERHLSHSELLRAVSRKVGARDPDDLWDGLYESDFRNRESEVFFAGVLAYCAVARAGQSPEAITAEGHEVREAAMAAEISEGEGRTVVVTGGFHTVALPGAVPRRPPRVELARPADAGVTLMRYNFEQLDRLNGYGAGMPSPEFYQRVWEGRDVAELVVEIARRLRERHGSPSSADAIGALDQLRRLAGLRAHRIPTREDLLDAVRSHYVKGSLDVEGVAVLATARQYLAGDRMGEVPAGAGRPPLVEDFEAHAAAHRIALRGGGRRELTLDLYRSGAHREASRFLRRLDLLSVPFAKLVRGPDFVAGKGLERIQEVWRYEWQPSSEAALIDRSSYGATLEEAATNLLLDRFRAADGAGHRSDQAASLLLEACRCGLHAHTASLLDRTRALVAADPRFPSVVGACEQLLLLGLSREPLEAHGLEGLEEAADQAWYRAARLVAALAATPEAEEDEALHALAGWRAAADTLGDGQARREVRATHLRALIAASGANPATQGAAAGLLYGDGVLEGSGLGVMLAGRLAGGRTDVADGARFLRGVLRAARSACWQIPEVVRALHETLASLDEGAFIELLPHLRLAYADLTPRETDLVACAVAEVAGVTRIPTSAPPGITQADVLRGLRLDQRVRDQLTRDGLDAWTR